MYRVANGTQNATLPTPATPIGTPGYFADQNDGASQATIVDPDWLNTLQEEIVNVILAASIALSPTTRNQLLAAIQALIAAGANAFLADTGTPNSYVVTPTIPLGSYAAGDTLVFKAANANTGASTLNVSALGAVAILHRDGSPLQAGDIPAGAVCRCVHDGAHFQLEDAIPTLATTSLEGLTRYATNAEAAAMAIGTAALTPANLAGLLGSSNFGFPGYWVGPGGFCVQWGMSTLLLESQGGVTQTLATTFSTLFIGAVATPYNPSAGTFFDNWPDIVTAPNTAGPVSSFQLMQQQTGPNTGAMQVFWIAIGKI